MIVELRGVNKFFGDLHVLQDVDFAVQRGEVVVIVGPSGSGKSTLLRIINALEPIQGGRVVVDGVNVHDHHTDIYRLRSEVGMVFQGFNLFANLTALDNVSIGLQLVKKSSKQAARDKARQYLSQVGLADKAGSHPSQLSGGQQQRVAIARALAMEPKVMLFDEVTSALDPELVGEVLTVMKQLADEGMTMLVVTHEMSFGEKVADRVVMFDEGAVIEEGSPDKIFTKADQERTRRFLNQLHWEGT
jgi:ABC-type polar amino acid transport system ATPase subunit